MIRKEIDKMYVRELREEVRIMRQVNDGLIGMIDQRDAEIERLKSIDRAARDFIFERAKAEREEFAREALEETIASRRLKEKFKA